MLSILIFAQYFRLLIGYLQLAIVHLWYEIYSTNYFGLFVVKYRFSVTKTSGESGSGTFSLQVDDVRVAKRYLYVQDSCCVAASATIDIELTAGKTVKCPKWRYNADVRNRSTGFKKFIVYWSSALRPVNALSRYLFTVLDLISKVQ